MHQLYVQSVINDREREVKKAMEINRVYRHNRGFVTSQEGTAENGKNFMSLWFLMVAHRLKGVFQIGNKSDVNV